MEEFKKQNDNEKPPKIHPNKRANVFTKIFFIWLLPLFVKGVKKDLTEDDLYGPLDEHESSKLGDKLEAAWNLEEKKKNPSLWIAMGKVFGLSLMLRGVVALIIEFVFRLSQPLSLAKLMIYYTPNQTTVSKNEAYMYASFIVLGQLCNVLAIHAYIFGLMHLGMKMRVACCSLIYRKALKLNKSSLAQTTIGQMVNLLSNDVNRFDFAVIHIHHLWIAPLETILIMYLLYDYVGPTAMVGIGFLLMFIPLQMYLGKKTSSLRLKTAIKTDERVRLMNEIISGIQVIKMYTWEKPFAKLVEISRRNEIKQIANVSIVRALLMSFNIFINRTSIYLCVLTYILVGNSPNHQYVFTVSAFYAILRQTVTMFLPTGITLLAECSVSIKRIRKFLMYEEVESIPLALENGLKNGLNLTEKTEKLHQNGTLAKKAVGIDLQNVAVKWISTSPENVLNDIYLNVGTNQLVAIVGPVGSGKTTLLHTILKELNLSEGTMDVGGTISYASQEPWLFSGSVRQNILFGQEFDSMKYKDVIQVCALERDFKLFPYGDRTLVGERGVMLSGGQKARINLARAVYKDADIYLLDDPLSAVDTHVGKQLFDLCIKGYLHDKCTILVTHQLQYLRNVDRLYLLENGKIAASGTYEELQSLGSTFTNLLNDHKEDETEDEENKKLIRRLSSMTEDNKDNSPTQAKEQRSVGTISGKVYGDYFKSGGSWCKALGIFLVFFFTQVIASGTDWFITFWVNLEQRRSEEAVLASLANEQLNNTLLDQQINNKTTTINNEDKTFTDLYLTEENCLYIYSTLVVTIIWLTLFRSITFFRYCMKASTNLHNNMFNKIIYGKMKFFNTNDSGRILNRFSKDMGAIDEVLPMTLIDTMQIGLFVLAISIVVGSVNPWILIPTLIIASIFYGMRVIFLASSRDIKRLEGTTRSPVFSHISASLQGLSTIRAFKAQTILKKEFDNHQNLHSSAFYLFVAANRTFGFWLDIFCVAYTALVTLSFLFVENEIYGGNVGLALTQALNLAGMFQWGMRQWSELENSMTAVERVVEYTEIDPEFNKNTKEPPKLWPEAGTVQFEDVSLRYSTEEPYVLKNLNFSFNDKEKIGIVGRTGAGKSSLIYALFRLAEIDGKIVIDGVNTKEIPLHKLRSKISIIPQEPVLFSGTLRKNLDPFDEYSDEILWKALEEIELKTAVSDLSTGLDSKMSEGGSNFSVGQRQLLCLARAIIRNNKILVLDEATANVDPQTDALIQKAIRSKFANCTVLTIAHRLHTIMDSDRVLVMDSGSIVEFGQPHSLLQNTEGVFYGLVKQTGKGMAENLATIAEESFKNTDVPQ